MAGSKEEPNSLLMKVKEESKKVGLKLNIQKMKIMASSPISSIQFSSVAQSCLTLCDPMNCSTPGLPVHHQLPEFTQTHIHRVGDAIEPSHPLSSPSPWIMEKARELQKNIYFCFIDYAKAFDCVDHNKLWKILKEMGIPDHLTCLVRNLYTSQEVTKLDMEQQTGSKSGKEYVKAVYCHPAYLTYMQST